AVATHPASASASAAASHRAGAGTRPGRGVGERFIGHSIAWASIGDRPEMTPERAAGECRLFAGPTAVGLLLARLALGVLLPVIVLVMILLVWALLRRRPAEAAMAQRLSALEEQVRGLLFRVWTLEQGARARISDAPAPEPAPSPPTAVASAEMTPL